MQSPLHLQPICHRMKNWSDARAAGHSNRRFHEWTARGWCAQKWRRRRRCRDIKLDERRTRAEFRALRSRGCTGIRKSRRRCFRGAALHESRYFNGFEVQFYRGIFVPFPTTNGNKCSVRLRKTNLGIWVSGGNNFREEWRRYTL